MTEYEITMNKELRETYMNRVEVLDKVKKLFLIPGMEVMTTKQVAEYFEVNDETIQKLYQRNKKEIDSDGAVFKRPSEFRGDNISPLKGNKRGISLFELPNGNTLEVQNYGTRCFSQRAILRIAMLLRDSKIAKEIRTQLLNIFGNANTEDKLLSINEEQILWGEFGKAMMSGDVPSALQVMADIQKYHNRHIDALQKENTSLSLTNQCLAKETRTWDRRKVVVAMIRSLAHRVYNNDYKKTYSDFYKELRYKKSICLSQREGGKTKLDTVKEDEWDDLIQVAAAMLEEHGIPVQDVVHAENAELMEDVR